MRKLFLVILAAVAVISANFAVSAKEGISEGKVTAYYFHGTFRCYTCTMMERYAKEAIEENFKDALASGKLEFKIINVEERANRHYVNDYQLYTKSLVLSLVREGREVNSKNLTRIWEYARNRQKFFDYVNEEINSFLRQAQ